MMPLGIALKAAFDPRSPAFADFWLPLLVPLVLALVGSLIYHATERRKTERSWARLLTFSFVLTDLWVAAGVAILLIVGGFFPADLLPVKLVVLAALVVAAALQVLIFRLAKSAMRETPARAAVVILGLLLVFGVRWFGFAEVDAWWLVAVPPHQVAQQMPATAVTHSLIDALL